MTISTLLEDFGRQGEVTDARQRERTREVVATVFEDREQLPVVEGGVPALRVQQRPLRDLPARRGDDRVAVEKVGLALEQPVVPGPVSLGRKPDDGGRVVE